MNYIRTAAVTAAAVGLTIASLSSATAAAEATSAPKFLSASQLPAASTPWHADPVKKGVPEGLACTGGIQPKASTKYREFRTELDTGARQTTTVAASTAKAKALAAKLRTSIESCLDRLKEQYPTLEGESLYEGKVNVEEGAHVYSIDTSDTEVGSSDINLYSVGRDGRTVTFVQWGQLGDIHSAPLEGFKKTTRIAVAKLH